MNSHHDWDDDDRPCQGHADISGAARAAGVSERTLRRYIEMGYLDPERVPRPGGFSYAFSDEDIDQARRVAAGNLQSLAVATPGLCRWHLDQAESRGRSLPLADAGRELCGRGR
jgi:hypothetical protein